MRWSSPTISTTTPFLSPPTHSSSPPPSAVDCIDPQCGGHGVCVRGECVCSAGWAGVSCDDSLPACQEQCSGHGTYLPESDTCACQPNWTGPDCYTGKTRGFTRHTQKENEGKLKMHFTSLLMFFKHVCGRADNTSGGYDRHERDL